MISRNTFLHRQKGVVLILVALALLVLMGVAALAIDLSHAEVNKTRLQNLADALALSAAISLTKKESSLASETYTTNNTYPTFRNSAGNQEINNQNLTVTYSFAVNHSGPYEPASNTDFTRRFARVEVSDMNVATWFAGIMGFNNVVVSATAVAGTAPITPCDLAPFAMCAAVDGSGNAVDTNCNDNSNGKLGNDCYGYELDALICMKQQSSGTPDPVLCPASATGEFGPGNFGFLDLGNTSPSLEKCAAGDPSCSTNCNFKNGTIPTKTGQNVGPASVGFNTRFNIYGGNLANSTPAASTIYPPDQVTGGKTVPTGNGNQTKNVTDSPAYANPELNNGQPATIKVNGVNTPNPAFVNYVQKVGSETALSTAYSSYKNAYAPGTVSGVNAATIDVAASTAPVPNANGGMYGRRILPVPFVNCSENLNGKSDAKVVGLGCFFIAREYANTSVPYEWGANSSSDPYLYGIFVGDGCAGIGKASSTVNSGFYKVILYKDPLGGHS